MNKSELISAVASRTGQTRSDVDTTLKGFFEVVAETIGEGEQVTIPGWIKFQQTKRAARTGRNPATGKTINIGPSTSARISAGSRLKAAARGK